MGACVRLCVVLAVLPALASYPARDSVPAQSFSQQQARACVFKRPGLQTGAVPQLALARGWARVLEGEGLTWEEAEYAHQIGSCGMQRSRRSIRCPLRMPRRLLRMRGGAPQESGPSGPDQAAQAAAYQQRQREWDEALAQWQYCLDVPDGEWGRVVNPDPDPGNPLPDCSASLREDCFNQRGDAPGPGVWQRPSKEYSAMGFRVCPETAPIDLLVEDVRRLISEGDAERECARAPFPAPRPPRPLADFVLPPSLSRSPPPARAPPPPPAGLHAARGRRARP